MVDDVARVKVTRPDQLLRDRDGGLHPVAAQPLKVPVQSGIREEPIRARHRSARVGGGHAGQPMTARRRRTGIEPA